MQHSIKHNGMVQVELQKDLGDSISNDYYVAHLVSLFIGIGRPEFFCVSINI